jgi:uncharacterized protein YndB with AHSA1/START domain
MELKSPPAAKTAMLIRRPVAEVFEAFIDPAITSKFWFTKGTGSLEEGKQVQWEWEMYNFSVNVDVKKIETDKRIVVEWQASSGPTTIEWIFKPLPDGTTFVTIANSGFSGDGDEIVKQALDSTEGFTFVLAGAKAWLEHGVQLNLVPDRFPKSMS